MMATRAYFRGRFNASRALLPIFHKRMRPQWLFACGVAPDAKKAPPKRAFVGRRRELGPTRFQFLQPVQFHFLAGGACRVTRSHCRSQYARMLANSAAVIPAGRVFGACAKAEA